MNYLVHLYLAEPSPESLMGALMGDFVKGPLETACSPDYAEGIRRHRRTDRFAQENEFFRRSKRRLDDSIGHCKGILVDVFYDHFLARYWEDYSPLPLETFAAQVYHLLQSRHGELPPGLQQIAPRMISDNWLVSYREPATIRRVLERLSTRLARPNPLAGGASELERHYTALEDDFRMFLPAAAAFLAVSS